MTRRKINLLAKAVAAAAKHLDKTDPEWARNIASTVMRGNFDIAEPTMCVIGAGTGRIWTSDESEDLIAAVRKAKVVPKRFPLGALTADTSFEPFWLVEAFKRVQGTTDHRGSY